MSLDLSSFFSLSAGEGGCVFAVFFALIPEKGISDFIVHGSIIQVFIVCLNTQHILEDKPMPGSSAHIRSHKQARSGKLNEQQRNYQESMASSTISSSKSSCLALLWSPGAGRKDIYGS